VAALGLLADAATPLEKLHVLRDTSLTLQRCVERHCEAAGLELADVEYATDDILDMLLWVLAAAAATLHLSESEKWLREFLDLNVGMKKP
jgi:hypothetical protein